jgi:tRNA (guanosine-2'-O-)-methyltransferase
LASNKDNWVDIENKEASEDAKLREKFEKIHSAWDNLDPDLVDRATNVLVPFLKPERWDKIQTVLSQRTQNVRFLFENPANPSNVWACLRTLDSFGIQHVDVVMQSSKYKGKAALSQKRGMRTAMGSAKWLTLKNHVTTKAALEQLKERGHHIAYTDVNPESKDIRDVDWSSSGKKICIVMGNEQYGCSDDVKSMADESFYLPMTGMAESFNLSVATAITCAHLSASSQELGQGAIRNGDLDEKEYKTLLLKGALNSIDRRTVKALFKREGIELPKEIHIA